MLYAKFGFWEGDLAKSLSQSAEGITSFFIHGSIFCAG
jgi:hypothetical protein